jgi:hypothetical protein
VSGGRVRDASFGVRRRRGNKRCGAEGLCFCLSSSGRCAGKTDVFCYELEWLVAHNVEENVSTRISGAGSNFLFSKPDGQGNGDRGMMDQIPLSPFPCLFHASESGVFLASKAEGLCFCFSSSGRCAGKTDVFGYELDLSRSLHGATKRGGGRRRTLPSCAEWRHGCKSVWC